VYYERWAAALNIAPSSMLVLLVLEQIRAAAQMLGS